MSDNVYQIPRFIVLHCSDTPNGSKVSVEAIREDHIVNRGFSDIGYHMIIQPDGNVENGRPLNKIGAHVEGHNNGAIGICLVGNNKYRKQQFQALRYKLDSLFLTYSIKKENIFCHSQFDTAIKQGKTCPNIPINVILCWYYNIVSEQIIAPHLIDGGV